nr:unnamed protein product [Callosobruchus analis]
MKLPEGEMLQISPQLFTILPEKDNKDLRTEMKRIFLDNLKLKVENQDREECYRVSDSPKTPTAVEIEGVPFVVTLQCKKHFLHLVAFMGQWLKQSASGFFVLCVSASFKGLPEALTCVYKNKPVRQLFLNEMQPANANAY